MPKEANPITKKMTLGELVSLYPEAAPLLARSGMHCIGCAMSAMETIEQGCKAHGMSDKDIDELVRDMNKAAKAKK
jgi:hybrid cluster-associated redox disulfide protein